MASPRPYVAAAAAAALAALYFVPSASASPSRTPARTPVPTQTQTQARTPQTAARSAAHATAGATADDVSSSDLADTGAMNTKPYMIGGAAFLMAGAGLVVNAGRRSRHTLGARELDPLDDLDD